MRDFSLRVLRYNIISLDMEPGKMYSEKELSAALGLSRTPMREALLQLSKIKIIEIYPQRGSAVAWIDYDLVDEARFIREALECAVIKQVCQCVTDEQLAALSANVARQQKCVQQNAPESLLQLDNAFHKQLFTIANKMQSYDFASSMTIHFDRVRSMALAAVKDHRFVEEHAQIYKAVEDRDAQLAAELMHAHLSRYRVDEQALRERYPEYFNPTASRLNHY